MDDDVELTECTAQILEDDGFKVCTAFNGMDGIKSAIENQPDCIIMGLMMPRMCGDEACRRLKENESTKNIPVIGFSANSDARRLRSFYNAGICYFLSKPFASQELRNTIEKAMLNSSPIFI